PRPRGSPAIPRAPGGPPVILVAEDDADARAVMRQTLERRGFGVIEAADGRQALEAARRSAPDLIVLDLRMPAVHGRDVIRILRKQAATATVPIVVVSGSASERQSLESLVLGANVFLTKPANTDGLVADIHRLLSRNGPEERS
ncbi:MAG TPA: response regulator, partial [Vicinamibacterales bacterium]|nr:response regulator [Vicinamibacterales bacterium]